MKWQQRVGWAKRESKMFLRFLVWETRRLA